MVKIKFTPSYTLLSKGFLCLHESEAFQTHVAHLADMGLNSTISWKDVARASLCKSALGFCAEVQELSELLESEEFFEPIWDASFCEDLLSELGDVLFWTRQILTDVEGCAYYHLESPEKVSFDKFLEKVQVSLPWDGNLFVRIRTMFDSVEKLARAHRIAKVEKVPEYVQDVYSALVTTVGTMVHDICTTAAEATMPTYLRRVFENELTLIQAAMLGNVAKLAKRQLEKDFSKTLDSAA